MWKQLTILEEGNLVDVRDEGETFRKAIWVSQGCPTT
jgi:hypothetical protein